jgi:pyruvate-formate lyase-activating enzyme
VPTVNADPASIAAIAEFVGTLRHAGELVLLPFHRLADGKYKSLDVEHRAAGLATPTAEQLAELAEVARRFVGNVKVG